MREKSASHVDRGRKAQALRTPEQRSAIASQGHLAASVATVIKRASELNEDQVDALWVCLMKMAQEPEVTKE